MKQIIIAVIVSLLAACGGAPDSPGPVASPETPGSAGGAAGAPSVAIGEAGAPTVLALPAPSQPPGPWDGLGGPCDAAHCGSNLECIDGACSFQCAWHGTLWLDSLAEKCTVLGGSCAGKLGAGNPEKDIIASLHCVLR